MWGLFKLPIWVLPLVIAGLVAGFGWWGNRQLRSTVQAGLDAQLSATLNANVTALGIWSTNQIRLAMALADDPAVRRSAAAIFQSVPPARRDFRASDEVAAFVEVTRPRLVQLGYEVAQLVTTDLLVVANSARPRLIGNNAVSDAHTNQFAELFATGQPVIITPFRPEMLMQQRMAQNLLEQTRPGSIFRRIRPRVQPTAVRRRGDVTYMQVAAPVRDDAGRIIGALALIIKPDQEFSRILSVARSGRSGETYAFDQTGLLVSHSRFEKQLKQLGLLDETNTTSALNLRLQDPGGDLTKGYPLATEEAGARPLIRLVASALDGENRVVVEPSRDYRGVPVVGASCWLPQFGFGVATQINADEAYQPLRVLQLVFVVLVLFLLLCATGLFVFSYANLAWRQRLNAAELKLKQLGQYTLEEKVGEGGMGVVYRARHALLRRDTAVKLLLPGRADAEAVARFEREVCLTCQLTHPNTIQVYDYGHTPEGIFYYAMEYLRGVNLHDLVVRFGPQPESRVAYILAQICDSLAEAHGLGLIHRDIKPGNVFLCRRGGLSDCVKVLDFGLVREYRATASVPASDGKEGGDGNGSGGRVLEGTPWFMSPEAVRDTAPTDPRSDLYSLGALGYFLLTGCFIFDAETVEEVHEKQLTTPPVPLRERTANLISPEMEQILMRCLEKDKDQRPASAVELRALLLALPTAADWPPEARLAWWDRFEQLASPVVLGAGSSLPTVSIDLSGRVQ